MYLAQIAPFRRNCMVKSSDWDPSDALRLGSPLACAQARVVPGMQREAGGRRRKGDEEEWAPDASWVTKYGHEDAKQCVEEDSPLGA